VRLAVPRDTSWPPFQAVSRLRVCLHELDRREKRNVRLEDPHHHRDHGPRRRRPFCNAIGQAAGNFVLSKNSVGMAQIKKNAVNSLKVKNGTLMAADFKAGQLRAGPQGPKGDPGAQGPKGDPGAPAATGLTKTVQRYAPLQSVGAGSSAGSTAWCDAGEVATGGGGVTYDGSNQVFLITSAPAPGAVSGKPFGGWGVAVRNTSGSAQNFHAYVVCAS
jgi:hypothetical protein